MSYINNRGEPPHVCKQNPSKEKTRVWRPSNFHFGHFSSYNWSMKGIQSSNLKHNEIRNKRIHDGNSRNQNNNNDNVSPKNEVDDLNWEDEDFELNGFQDSTKNTKVDAGLINETIKEYFDNDIDKEDEWLQPLNLKTRCSMEGKAPTTADRVVHNEKPFRPRTKVQLLIPMMQASAEDKSVTTADGVFLTKQFHRLCTPVSQKKSRCALCTRPKQNDDNSIYCSKCEAGKG